MLWVTPFRQTAALDPSFCPSLIPVVARNFGQQAARKPGFATHLNYLLSRQELSKIQIK